MSERPLRRAELRRLLDEHGLEPSRALGQNFVVDQNTLERIVRLAEITPGQRVLEIGAGLGSLTLALANAGAEVTAVEIDRRLLPHLHELAGDRARIVEADALRADLGSLLGSAPGAVVVANLPYNIATPLVLRILEELPQVSRLLVMVQREVGERLAAPPGGRDYGAVSARIAYFAVARVVGRVSPEVFHPRPRVESALVEIVRRPQPAVDPAVASYKDITRLLRAGFGTRRKMLRRSLAAFVDEEGFVAAGVASTARAESLAIEEWGKLARWARPHVSSRAPS